MTENQKRLAIVAVVIIIALILFMRGGSNGASSVVDAGAMPAINDLQSPSISIGARRPFIMPDFANVNAANNLSAIGACCADCRPQTSSFRSAPSSGITFVTNRGNSGPNVYNYYSQPVAAPKPMLLVRMRGV